MIYRMKVQEAISLPQPPSLVGALTAGFDTAASKLWLILFPLALDLFIWLGPHLRLSLLFERFFDGIITLAKTANPQSVELFTQTQEVWLLLAERLNFIAVLRTFPVGIPSLMASQMPLESPLGMQNSIIEVPSFGAVILLWLFLSLIGMAAAALYFSSVAKAASPLQYRHRRVLDEWLFASIHVVLLAISWLVLILAVTAPSVFFISIIGLVSPAFSQVAIFLYIALLVWLIFPLLLSPHGIFLYRSSAFNAMKRSVNITRLTFPYTGLFFLAVFVLSQGLNIVWRIPPEGSWFTLVGLIGHSFITTGLLAASFIYYREADQFTSKLQTRWAQLAQLRSNI
jgi:hypothetical protein